MIMLYFLATDGVIKDSSILASLPLKRENRHSACKQIKMAAHIIGISKRHWYMISYGVLFVLDV